jgi:hypothetical protein
MLRGLSCGKRCRVRRSARFDRPPHLLRRREAEPSGEHGGDPCRLRFHHREQPVVPKTRSRKQIHGFAASAEFCTRHACSHVPSRWATSVKPLRSKASEPGIAPRTPSADSLFARAKRICGHGRSRNSPHLSRTPARRRRSHAYRRHPAASRARGHRERTVASCRVGRPRTRHPPARDKLGTAKAQATSRRQTKEESGAPLRLRRRALWNQGDREDEPRLTLLL